MAQNDTENHMNRSQIFCQYQSRFTKMYPIPSIIFGIYVCIIFIPNRFESIFKFKAIAFLFSHIIQYYIFHLNVVEFKNACIHCYNFSYTTVELRLHRKYLHSFSFHLKLKKLKYTFVRCLSKQLALDYGK